MLPNSERSKHYCKLNLTSVILVRFKLMFISNNSLITRVVLTAKINLITMQFFSGCQTLFALAMSMLNTSRRLTNISKSIFGKVAKFN